MRENFYVKFTQLLNNKIYTLSQNFVKTYMKITTLCCFNQDIGSIVFTSNLLVAVKRAG